MLEFRGIQADTAQLDAAVKAAQAAFPAWSTGNIQARADALDKIGTEIISRGGIPAGVFNLVMGRGSVIGDPLVNHPGVNAISFTGSQGVGHRVAQQCAPTSRRCSWRWVARTRRSSWTTLG